MAKLNSNWVMMITIAAVISVTVWTFLAPRLKRAFNKGK